MRLDVGLQPIARRALAAVAHADRQRVACAQIAAADADHDRVLPGPDVGAVEPDFELGAVARLDRGEVRRLRLVELRLAHVGRGPPRDLQHAGVVDAERAGGVDERQLGVGARDERPRRRELDRAHVLGKVGRIRHDDSRCGGAAALAGRKKDRYDSRCRTKGESQEQFPMLNRCAPLVAHRWRSPAPLRRLPRRRTGRTGRSISSCPIPAGGSTDLGARVIADHLSRSARPAGRGREQVGRQRQRRHRIRRQERAGRLHRADRARTRSTSAAARLQGELRSAEGFRAGDPAFPAAGRARGAS